MPNPGILEIADLASGGNLVSWPLTIGPNTA
jgi:hypothetical protein